ncbi:MAG: hypothetical protein ACLUEJ_00815 [Clostridium sp.]
MEESYIEWLVKRKDPIYALPVKIIMVLVCAFSVLLALQTVIGCDHDSSRYRYLFYFPEFKCGI